MYFKERNENLLNFNYNKQTDNLRNAQINSNYRRLYSLSSIYKNL